ncbi:hypothetical protein EDF42_2181 [Curtobacterium sp. PhB172]|uniref:hypothetical protein n=1 Tax=Curtobacterium sp. PhB172 TaxID=2485196 RepID=UPI000F94CE7C|nr:hypothetical protein [Curtobacterium sp. PhB172]ROS63927.1 hypothetical protein EDF42_2181 [Curtobacterium sp. PhB172]
MNRHARIASVFAAAAAIGILLASCSGGGVTDQGESAGASTSETKTTAPTPVEHIADTWTFDYQGATGTFKLSGDPSNADVAAVEAARASVDGEAVTLVPVELDNTAGTEDLNMYGVTIVTKDGQQIESIDLADKFSAWEDAAGDDVDKYNALVDVNNKYTLFDLAPGAKGTALLAFDEPVTSAWRVTVMPAGGFDEVEASPGQ